MHFCLFSDLGLDLQAFSQLFLAHRASPAISHVHQVCGSHVLLVSPALSFCDRDSSAVQGTLPLEGTRTLGLGTARVKNGLAFPSSCRSSYRAQQIETSDRHSSCCCLIYSLEKKNEAPHFHTASGNQQRLAPF